MKAVRAVRDTMLKENKALPFFILDELSLDGGMSMAAFQRNVFRVCGLVMVVMGTDARATKLLGDDSRGSYKDEQLRMTIVYRFPRYQLLLSDREEQRVWGSVVLQFPVVKDIAMRSCGRFARYFVDSAVEYATANEDFKLYDLLDTAFCHVSRKTQGGKGFRDKRGGLEAQLAAISYSTITPEPPRKKRKTESVEINFMHLHFANLVDEPIFSRSALWVNPRNLKSRRSTRLRRWLPMRSSVRREGMAYEVSLSTIFWLDY